MKFAKYLAPIIAIGAVAYFAWPAKAPQQAAPVNGAALADLTLPASLSDNAQIGKIAFEANCASCHGANLEGEANWKQEIRSAVISATNKGIDRETQIRMRNGLQSILDRKFKYDRGGQFVGLRNIPHGHSYQAQDFLVRVQNPRLQGVTNHLVAMAENNGCDLPDLSLEDMQSVHTEITQAVYDVLGVHNSVASRTSYGGTAPAQVRAQIARWKDQLA